MSIRNFLKIFLHSAAPVALIAILSTGCARFGHLTEDKSYLTPIPQATLDAFQFGLPVKTKLQAVIAAQKGILTFHMDWVGQPVAIFAETMTYEQARQRVEGPDSTSYYDPTQLDTQVWLVVFRGEFSLIEPLGTKTPPTTGCGYVVLNVKDGSGMRAGSGPCKSLNFDQ
jgi:hypothetical protein